MDLSEVLLQPPAEEEEPGLDLREGAAPAASALDRLRDLATAWREGRLPVERLAEECVPLEQSFRLAATQVESRPDGGLEPLRQLLRATAQAFRAFADATEEVVARAAEADPDGVNAALQSAAEAAEALVIIYEGTKPQG